MPLVVDRTRGVKVPSFTCMNSGTAKPKAKSIVWEHIDLQAGKDGKPPETRQAFHVKFVDESSVLKNGNT